MIYLKIETIYLLNCRAFTKISNLSPVEFDTFTVNFPLGFDHVLVKSLFASTVFDTPFTMKLMGTELLFLT